MKKKILTLLLIILAFMLTACDNSHNVDDNKLNIVASFYPMYIATSNIIDGASNVELSLLASPDVGCLHDYQLTVNDMMKLENADIFVINGSGMESFLDKAISTYPQINIITASEGLVIEEENELQEDLEHFHKHNHNHEINSHVWVSIPLYIEEVKNITNKLIEIDNENAEIYQKNCDDYIIKLNDLNTKMHAVIDKFEHKDIVTFHEAFNYFADELDLNIVAVIEREPGTSPSAKDVASIIDEVRLHSVNAIFVEPQYLKTAATTIANETKVNVYELDPIVSGGLEKEAYIDIMEKNLKVLEEALK